jgi:hypothetical protein
VIPEVKADEGAKFDNLVIAVIFAQFVKECGVDLVWIGCHQFAVAQRYFIGLGKSGASSVVIYTFVQQLFRKSLSLRRSRPNIPSIAAGRHA